MITLIAYLQILRPLNLCITLFCIIISRALITFKDISLLPLVLVILLITSFANIINDIFDYKIDLINKPNRPIANGKIKIKAAFIYALILLVTALLFIFIYNFNDLAKQFIFINLFLIILYTPFLKKIPFIGNLVIAFILCMVFITTTAYLQGNFILISPIVIFSFLLMLVREIIKDIADLKGDKFFGVRTLPVVFGINKSFNLIVGLSILLAFSVYLVYSNNLINLFCFIAIYIFVIIPLFYHLYCFYKNKSSKYCIYLSKVLKLLTIFGMIVIYLTNI